jgi:dUTP pyrophosphatase
MRKRGFEIIERYRDKAINLPRRQTPKSAGYDIESAEDKILMPHVVTMIETGLKAYMQDDEYLSIHIRSGLSIRNSLSLINGEGVIDADYYNNPGNEGHIMVALINHGEKPVTIKKGERIAQGIFRKYLTADSDDINNSSRKGGFGSTG